jgi:hypothetical protein
MGRAAAVGQMVEFESTPSAAAAVGMMVEFESPANAIFAVGMMVEYEAGELNVGSLDWWLIPQLQNWIQGANHKR